MNDLVKSAFTILFARGFTRVAQFIAFLLFARLLTPIEFGWFGILTTGFALAALLGSLGLRQSLAHQIGTGGLTVGEATATALAAWPILSIVSAIVLVVIYGSDLPGVPSWGAWTLIIAGVAGTMLIMLLQGIYLGRGAVNDFSLTETAPRVLLAAFALVLLITGANFAVAIWAHVLSFVLVIPLALWMAWRNAENPVVRPGRLGVMIAYGVPFAINMFLVTLCARLSMFVIEHFYDAAHAGQFFAAVRVNEIFLEAATAFGLVLFSNAVRNSGDSAVIARNARIACGIFWVFTVLAIGIALAAPLLLTLLLGSEYSGAGLALQIMAVGLGPAAASKIVYPTIAGQGKPLFGTIGIGVSLVVNAGLAWLLVPGMGVSGGAIALVMGQYVLYIGYAISCSRLFGVPLRSFFVPQLNDLRALGKSLVSFRSRLLRAVR